MAFINWDKSLSVGILSFDDQHQKLFDLINEFYDNIKNKSNDENILALVKGMKDYTKRHFASEESFMKKHGFPEYEPHKQEHNDFIKKVEDVEERLKSRQVILSFEITSFLKQWIQNHIKGTDMNYSEFLIAKGVV